MLALKDSLAKRMGSLLQDLEVEKKASALSQAQQQASKANIALQEGEAQKAAREEEMARLTGTVSCGYGHPDRCTAETCLQMY